MSDHVPVSTDNQHGAWWRRALLPFNANARRWLKRRYPSILHLHEDLVAETMLQLTAHLAGRPQGVPASWFESDTPLETESARFQAFAITVLKRRVMDHFRSDFREWARRMATDDGGSSGRGADWVDEGIDLGRSLDLDRMTRLLISIIAEMPESDRLLMEEVALGGRDTPLDACERQRVSRLRRRLLKEMHVRFGQDPVQLLQRYRGCDSVPNEVAILQIIHFSDMHLALTDYVKTRWKLSRIYPRLSRDQQQGWAGARPAVLNEFIRVIRGLTSGDQIWKDRPTWLVDTGDGTTFGDRRSLHEWQNWGHKFEQAAGPHGRLMRVYGNHDGWPGTFPLLAPGHMASQRDFLQKLYFTQTWPETPWAVAVPGTAAEIQLCAVNTVNHELGPNTLALGAALRDRHWASVLASSLATPADDLARKAQVRGDPTGNLRIAAMHYPTADAATPGAPVFQKVMVNRTQFAAELRTHPMVTPLVTHLLLAGHTHLAFPGLGELPRSASACQHRPLTHGQCQIVSGSLSQDVLPGATLKAGATWAEHMAFQNPYQCTLLRFYSQPHDLTEIIMERSIIGADDSALFSFLPIAPQSNAVNERMTFRL